MFFASHFYRKNKKTKYNNTNSEIAIKKKLWLGNFMLKNNTQWEKKY